MRSMILSAALSFALGGAAAAQTAPPPEVAGDWKGLVNGGEFTLPVVLHLGAVVTGDSPMENRFGIPGKLETVDGKYKVSFETGGVVEAVLKDGRLEGFFSKDGHQAPLTLEREAPAAKPKP